MRGPMGYIYETMDRTKENIVKNLENFRRKYVPIWKIIDARWNVQLYRLLHAVIYFVNLTFHYEETFEADLGTKYGLYDCIDRMVPTSREIIKEQIDKLNNAMGLLGKEVAVLTGKTKPPANWLDSYGDSTP